MAKKILISVFVMFGIIFIPQYDVKADIWDDLRTLQIDYDRTIQKTQDMIRTNTSLHIRRTQTSEIIRGQDLRRAIENSMMRNRDAQLTAKIQKENLLLMAKTEKEKVARVLEAWREKMLHAKNTDRVFKERIAENKRKVDINRMKQEQLKRSSEDQMRRIKERARDAKQRMKDLTRNK